MEVCPLNITCPRNATALNFAAGAVLALVAVVPANADVVINFSSLSSTLTASQTSSQGAALINTALGIYGSGASVSGAITDGSCGSTNCPGGAAYNGEGYVTGTTSGPWYNPTVTPVTLATPNVKTGTNTYLGNTGGTFLVNQSSAFGGNSNDIYLAFNLATGVTMTGISFDYEIYPDGSGQRPDLSLYNNGVQLGSTIYAYAPGGSGGSYYTHSPNSGYWTETSPQLIGNDSITGLSLTGGINLDFQDWPPTIGINDITIYTSGQPNTGRSSVPEPSAIMLLGTAVVAVLAPRLRKKF